MLRSFLTRLDREVGGGTIMVEMMVGEAYVWKERSTMLLLILSCYLLFSFSHFADVMLHSHEP